MQTSASVSKILGSPQKGCLFLGDWKAATDLELLKSLGISHVVNCTQAAHPFEGKLEYARVRLADIPEDELTCQLDPIFLFIEEALSKPTNILEQAGLQL